MGPTLRRFWAVNAQPPNGNFSEEYGFPDTRVTDPWMEWDGNDFVVGAECSLDGAAPVPCASPYRLSGLSEGPHRFEVVVIDVDGPRDPTPAVLDWVVDSLTPHTSLLGHVGLRDAVAGGGVHLHG